MAFDKLKAMVVKRALGQFGIDPGTSLPELIEQVNDAFDVGLKVAPVALTADNIVNALSALASEAEQEIKCGPGGEGFAFEAMRDGIPIRGFVLVGGKRELP